ncbi:hypothetical protein IJG78_00475 [Candidatus Saccharibacteria bacterium]|nr:hypothetical protein [Candidatus Saccharibacteria bacterium]
MINRIKTFIKKYPLPIIIIITLIFFAVILVITVANLYPSKRIEVLVAPESASITINGKPYKNGTYNLPVGNLSVKIEKEGFKMQEFIFDSSSSDKLYTYLVQDDGSLSWYDDHQEDAIIMTTIGDYQASIMEEQYNQENPIISHLPIIFAEYDNEYNYIEFRIDGGSFSNCHSSFCLKVTDTTGNNLEHAKKLISDAGFNPDDFEILYEYTPIVPLE